MRRVGMGVAVAVAVLLAWNGTRGRDAAGDGIADVSAEHRQPAVSGAARDPEPPAFVQTSPRNVSDRDGALSPETLRAMAAWEQAYRTTIRRHLEQRAAAGDVHAQLTLALMTLAPSGALSDPSALERRDGAEAARRSEALARALEMAPDDPLVAWHVAEDCSYRRIGCDKQAAWQRLRELDADNAAVWLLGLDALLESGDVEALDLQLALFADADRFDNLLAATGRLLAEQLVGIPMPEPGTGLRQAMGQRLGLDRPLTAEEFRYLPTMEIWTAQTIAAVGPVQACVGVAAMADPALCNRVGARLSTGSSLVERAIGLVLQVQLTAGHPEGPRWREALRRHYWQSERLMAIAGETPPPGYLHRMLADGEVNALEWRLARTGMSEPPPGWLPVNPRHRALVTTGRPPPGG